LLYFGDCTLLMIKTHKQDILIIFLTMITITTQKQNVFIVFYALKFDVHQTFVIFFMKFKIIKF